MMFINHVARSTRSGLTSVAATRGRLVGVLAALVVMLVSAGYSTAPSASAAATPSAEGEACPAPGVMWHFQNYTPSGKTIELDGYSGSNGTGKIVQKCTLLVRKASAYGFKSRGAEAWLNAYSVKSVKIISWSDAGGGPVTAGPIDNNSNACFRINHDDNKTTWELALKERDKKCNTNE